MDTFHIVTIGPPESGKTVYLAAMNHALGNQAALGRHLSAVIEDPAPRSALRRLYQRICDPSERAWPPSTLAFDPMREYAFRVSVTWTRRLLGQRTRLYNYTVFNVSYVDYAGEWVSDSDEHAAELVGALAARAEQAHALVGVIDGLRLLQYMEGNPAAESFLTTQVRPVVEFMEGRSAPVHFVITKWDLFAGRYTLADVRARLLGVRASGFERLIGARTAEGGGRRSAVGTVRLIPVSSVGGLAVLKDDWTVEKATGGEPEPVNVIIPFVAAVNDIAAHAAEQLRAARPDPTGNDRLGDGVQKAGASLRERLAAADAPDLRIGLTGIAINLRTIVTFMATGGKEAVKILGTPAARTYRSVHRQAQRVRARDIRGVTSPESALYYIARELRRHLDAFEAREPASMLSAPGSVPH
ncbi:hypothetical protein [Dactylosporangium sp. NPDC049140]|jgi:hypothetical protein|uniref:hypothetical protein n=1 Tax=Dactylosporangium sp. NPDC049140 TaxID=3155647 RepID=UPI0033C532A4